LSASKTTLSLRIKKLKFHTRYCINKHTHDVYRAQGRGGNALFQLPKTKKVKEKSMAPWVRRAGSSSSSSSSSSSMAVFEDSLAAVGSRIRVYWKKSQHARLPRGSREHEAATMPASIICATKSSLSSKPVPTQTWRVIWHTCILLLIWHTCILLLSPKTWRGPTVSDSSTFREAKSKTERKLWCGAGAI